MCDCRCHEREGELPDECFCSPECIRGEPEPGANRMEVRDRYKATVLARELRRRGQQARRSDFVVVIRRGTFAYIVGADGDRWCWAPWTTATWRRR
jgi:hypothetical protein